jgi:hypothetical protein
MPLNELERNILKAKGLTDEQLARLSAVGIHSKADFATVGDANTLAEVSGLPKDEIPKRLAGLSPAEKEALWGRVRKGR